MHINQLASCDVPGNPVNTSTSYPCNARPVNIKTSWDGRNEAPSNWNKLIPELMTNVMSYLPINEVVKCYTLDKRTCTIIRNSILKPKMNKIGMQVSKYSYSREYYKNEIRPWLKSLGQDHLVRHLDFAIHGQGFHQLLCLLVSEVFQSAQRFEIVNQYISEYCRNIKFNCDGSIVFVEESTKTTSILACNRNNGWSEMVYFACEIRAKDAVFSPDGSTLALRIEDDTLLILSFGRDESGMMKVRQKDELRFKKEINSLQFSLDGQDLLFKLSLDSDQGRTLLVIVSLNSQGQWLVTKEIEFPVTNLTPAEFSPDGTSFAIGSTDNSTTQFFTNAQQRQIEPVWSYRGIVDCVYNTFYPCRCRWVKQPSDSALLGYPQFSPDGTSVELFTLDSDKTFLAKQVKGSWVIQQEFDTGLSPFEFSPDGQTFAAIFRNKHRYDALCIFARNSAGDWVESHRYFYDLPIVEGTELESSIVSVNFTADNEYLWIHHRPGIVDIRQKLAGEWQVVYRAEHPPEINQILDSDNGKNLAISTKSGILSILSNNARLWKEQLRIEGQDLHCCFSHDNQRMAVVTGAGYARILEWYNQHWRFRTDWFLACPEGDNSVEFYPNDTGILINHANKLDPFIFGTRKFSKHIFKLIPVMV